MTDIISNKFFDTENKLNIGHACLNIKIQNTISWERKLQNIRTELIHEVTQKPNLTKNSNYSVLKERQNLSTRAVWTPANNLKNLINYFKNKTLLSFLSIGLNLFDVYKLKCKNWIFDILKFIFNILKKLF